MPVPGFTAGASIFKSSDYYRVAGAGSRVGHVDTLLLSVFPSALPRSVILPKFLLKDLEALNMFKKRFGKSPGSCELACGAERADCFREGGSKAQCNSAHDLCSTACVLGFEEGAA
jgi:hypothetical protein